MDEKTLTLVFPSKPVGRDWFSGSVLFEGLRSHLETGGFSSIFRHISDFDMEDEANLKSCHEFIHLVKEDFEEIYPVSSLILDNEERGFKIDFVRTICADAIAIASGSNHYRNFKYINEGPNLKFGAYIIYTGYYGQDLKPFENVHRRMREKFCHLDQPQQIARQIPRIDKILTEVKQQLEKFLLLEYIPGRCSLCS